jgi:two-component system, LytTR family, response regulator LytT
MIRWNIAICDDEKNALNILSGALVSAFRSYDVDAVVETFSRPQALLSRMKTCTFDLLFLDIEMPGMSGLSLAEQLRKDGKLLDIIFISNREELIFDALRFNPKGFIRKSRFFQDVDGVIKTYFTYRKEETNARALIVEDREQVNYIAIDTLIYIESTGKKQLAHIVGKNQPMEMRKQMQQLETELTPHGFLRIHKGYLVNYRFIRKICENDVILTNGEQLAVSRRRLTEIREKYMELMQSEGALVL